MAVFQEIDGIGHITDPSSVFAGVNPGLFVGKQLLHHGQTGNTVATNVANQPDGTVALPAISNGATGSVTISNTLIISTSRIFCEVRRGTTVPAAGAIAAIIHDGQAPGTGSCVFDLRNAGTAATLSTDYEMWYWIQN